MLLLCSTPGGQAEEERRHRADPVPPISTGPCIRWLSCRHRHNKPQFYGVLTVFCCWDLRWDPCVLPLIRADPGTFPVAGIWIRANFGAGIRSHLPAGPPGALLGQADATLFVRPVARGKSFRAHAQTAPPLVWGVDM